MNLKVSSEQPLRKLKPTQILTLILALIPPTFLAWFIHRFGVDVPFADQWNFIPLLDQVYSGRLPLEPLISQHNEHRLLFPRMIMLVLAYWSDWNTRWEMAANHLIASATCLVLLLQAQRPFQDLGSRIPSGLVIGISVIIFSIKQHANWLWGWQIAIFLNVLAVVSGIYLLSHRPLTWMRFLGAIACAVVASFSFGNGLLLWGIGLMMLALVWFKDRRTSIAFPISWLLAGSLLTGVYLNGFRVPSRHPSPWTVLEQPIEYVQYMLSFLGNPISTEYALLMGFLALSSSAVCLFLLVKRHDVRTETLLPLIALSLYSIGSAALIGTGRLGFGVEQALRSRYVTMANLCWVALIALIALLVNVRGSRRQRGEQEQGNMAEKRGVPHRLALGVALSILIAILLIQTQLTSSQIDALSLPDVHQFSKRHLALTAARQELLVLENEALLKTLRSDPRYLRSQIGVLKRHGLSVFRVEPSPAE